MSGGNAELARVREEIGRADEALVRDLVALDRADDPDWVRQAVARPAFRARVALGVKVAESKYRGNPGLFGPAAWMRDEAALEKIITDVAVEAAVLERVRRQAAECGGGAALAERVADLYRDQVIPETKRIQIRRLCEMGSSRVNPVPRRLRDVHGGLVQPLVAQLILWILAGLILDGGFVAGIVAIGSVAHWVAVGIIALRRREALTAGDVVLVRYGFLIWMAGFVLVCLLLAAGCRAFGSP